MYMLENTLQSKFNNKLHKSVDGAMITLLQLPHFDVKPRLDSINFWYIL